MIQFDALSIKQRLQDRLKNKTSWANILFYSTNQRLIDIFAEELAYDMQYDEVLTRESKWSVARQRTSLLAETQFFNYTPYRKIGAIGTLTVSSSPTFNQSYARNITIQKFDVFSSGDLNFVSVESTSLLSNETSREIAVAQGTPKTETFIALGSVFETFSLVNDSIENSLFEIYVNNTLVTVLDNIREASSANLLVCTVDNTNDMSGVNIRFGNDSYGKKLVAGDVVLVKYIETEGDKGNVDSSGIVTSVISTFYDTAGNAVDLYCNNTGAISGGLDYEEIEDIRAKAPKAYQTGDRAINKDDYASIVESFNFVKKSIAWGEAETNEDLGNLPGTYIASEENVVHISVISSTEDQLTYTQENTIRSYLNDRKPPTDIVVFEPVNFIYAVFNTHAYVKNKQYTLTYIADGITTTLENTYSITNLEFKTPIRMSDYFSLIDQVTGVDYHETTVSFYKFEDFNLAYSADVNIEMEDITPSSVRVYVKNKLNTGAYLQVAHDDGSGVLVADTGYTVAGSTINYLTGAGNIIVTGGLTSDFTNYSVKIEYSVDSTNIVPTTRYQFISYGTSTVTAEYE